MRKIAPYTTGLIAAALIFLLGSLFIFSACQQKTVYIDRCIDTGKTTIVEEGDLENNSRIIYRVPFEAVYAVEDDRENNVCYIYNGYEKGGISCVTRKR